MKKTADEQGLKAAQRMMKTRGYVVIGLPPGETVRIGDCLGSFASAQLYPEYVLGVAELTTRRDWDQQAFRLFGVEGPLKHPKVKGQTFYRCTLIKRRVPFDFPSADSRKSEETQTPPEAKP